MSAIMHSLLGEHAIGAPQTYTHDSFLTDLSNQMALSQASRRHSRGSTGQRAGSAMRVVKPSSTSNSPRSSVILNRRRTLMGEAQTQRRPYQAPEYLSMVQHHDVSQAMGRPARPVSWHPSSEAPPWVTGGQQLTKYPFSTPNMHAEQQGSYLAQPMLSPVMTYSSNTSPASTFSPLPVMAGGPHLGPADSWDMAEGSVQFYQSGGAGKLSELLPPSNDATTDTTPAGHGLDWNSYVMQSYNNTTPPTPDSFPQVRDMKTSVSEESIPFEELDDAEEEGEILVGMGLYDTPEKRQEDPQLNNYRSTVTSLLGSRFRSEEPTGRGLKLEETWEPPKSEDGEDDNEEEAEESNEDDDLRE